MIAEKSLHWLDLGSRPHLVNSLGMAVEKLGMKFIECKPSRPLRYLENHVRVHPD